jgi:hypothetical protein
MVTGVDIRLEPVPGGTAGELFKFRVSKGTTFIFSEEIHTSDDTLLTVLESGNGYNDRVFMVPIRNVRYIFCYYA